MRDDLLPPPLVLVVEDHDDTREILCLFLGTNGFRCIEAADGQSALKLAADRSPDVILLDIGLPDLDGCEVRRRLCQNATTQAIPVIAVTARAMPHDKQRLHDSGFETVLVKPCDIERVLAELQRCLPSQFRS